MIAGLYLGHGHGAASTLWRMSLQRSIEQQRFIQFGHIASAIIHDLASPLTALKLRQNELTPELRTTVDYMERYLQSAQRQLQSVSEIQSFRVRQHAREVLCILEHCARKRKVELVLIAGRDYRLWGDPAKFGQIILNLVCNAIEAYDNWPHHPRRVDITIRRLHGDIVVTVADQAGGMPARRRFDLLQPFRTTKTGHVGLGLTLARQGVKDFNGSLKINSRASEGTTFTVVLRHARR